MCVDIHGLLYYYNMHIINNTGKYERKKNKPNSSNVVLFNHNRAPGLHHQVDIPGDPQVAQVSTFI